jgi:RNA polymerase sigma-70 factor (ECF subfamily)
MELREIDEIRLALERGDTSAFGKLYDKFAPMVLSVLRNVARCPRSELDFHLNEVMFSVYRGLRGFRGASKFSTWIYRCTLRYSYALSGKLRAERRSRAPLDEELPAPVEMTEASDDRAFRALACLDNAGRAAVELYYIRDLDVRETAAALGISENAVKNRLFHARRKMRKALAGEETQ